MPTTSDSAVLCHVSGRVQGVYFRASTREIAERLGLFGYAKNLADGRVEVLAIGAESNISALVDWLWQGPPAAHVTSVEIQPIAPNSDQCLQFREKFTTR